MARAGALTLLGEAVGPGLVQAWRRDHCREISQQPGAVRSS